ncbi:MAG: hypothetical protein E4H36_05550 [Spirochaetales bacterium]|nr:MAG: hypothetical protein E4H36_05550 [Spirochaetales bacterium]
MPSREIRRVKQKKAADSVHPLEERRNKKPFLYIFSLGLLVLIVVTFIGVPIASKAGGSQGRSIFGTYGKKYIEFIYGNYFSNQVNALAAQISESLDKQNVLGQTYQVWREAFNRTVVHLGILSETDTAGMYITEQHLDEEIYLNGPYMENGEFSENLFNEASITEKVNTRKTFREGLREQEYRQDLFEHTKYSTEEINFLKSMASPERSFFYVTWAYSDYPLDEVTAYGRENSDLFRKIKLSRIAIKTSEAEAKKILEQLNLNGSRFEDLAKNQSTDTYAEKGGDMGYKMYYELQSDFKEKSDLDTVFELSPGDISKVIAGPSLWFIYRCDESPSAPDLTNEEMLKTVRTYMERFEAGKIEDYLTGKARDLKTLAAAEGFDKASQSMDKAVFTTDFFPVNYGGTFFFSPVRSMSEDTALNTAAYNENFFLETFKLKKDEISEPVIMGSNIILAQFHDERDAPEENLLQLDYYYPYIVQQFRDESLSRYFLTSPKFSDNFNEKFAEMFVPQGSAGE